MIIYNIISVYFFIMVIAVVYWSANIKALNGSLYAYISVLLSFAICFYVFGYAMELNVNTESQILFWNKFEYLGIPFVSALWFTVGLIYTGSFSRHKALLLAFIYIIPLISMILRFTNDYHYLYFSSVNFVNNYGKLLLVRDYGPGMMIQAIHSMFMVVVTLGLFIQDFVRNKEKEYGKIILIAISSFFAIAGLILSYVKPFEYIIDYMAICLPFSCLMIIIALLKYDFLSAKSLARSKAFESNRDALLLISGQNKIIDYNKNAKLLFSMVNINLSQGYMDTIFQDTPVLLERLKSMGTSLLKLNIESTNRYYEISTRSINSNNLSQGWIKTIRDVTEEYKLNKNLKRQAMIDDLSGLSNRRAFIQIGEKMIAESDRSGKTLHLLMMDLDHFKTINDQYGHLIGDQVIQYMGTALKAEFHSNSLIARLGGEEFGVLLLGFSDTEVEEKTDMFKKNVVAHEHSYRDQRFHVTVSIGIVKKSRPEQTLHKLMSLADKALYQSKDCGRNCVTVFEGM